MAIRRVRPKIPKRYKRLKKGGIFRRKGEIHCVAGKRNIKCQGRHRNLLLEPKNKQSNREENVAGGIM